MVTGYLGEPASIRCNYPKEYTDSPKTLCRTDGGCDAPFAISKGTSQEREEGRVLLSDHPNEGLLMVNITRLITGDGGEYQCAVLSKPEIKLLATVHLSGE